MRSFFEQRGPWLAVVVAIMLAISLTQGGISYSITFGPLQEFMPNDRSAAASILLRLRFGLIAVLAALWIAKLRHALFSWIVVANAAFTLALLVHTVALIAVLFGSASEAIKTLLLDVVLMATSNILIFSVWYWIIDPPGVEGAPRADERWDFLFPQRGGVIPHYESWVPRYVDYLFIAFTTSFAFSPTDTLPLTKRAKALMMLQAAISVATLTAIAGSAINILAGGK